MESSFELKFIQSNGSATQIVLSFLLECILNNICFKKQLSKNASFLQNETVKASFFQIANLQD